jgi:hypothetical protein
LYEDIHVLMLSHGCPQEESLMAMAMNLASRPELLISNLAVTRSAALVLTSTSQKLQSLLSVQHTRSGLVSLVGAQKRLSDRPTTSSRGYLCMEQRTWC